MNQKIPADGKSRKHMVRFTRISSVIPPYRADEQKAEVQIKSGVASQ